jgi:hypothetical protein
VAGGAWSGDVALSGSQSTGPISVASTYSLTCSGAEGNASATASLNIGEPVSGRFPLHVEPGKHYLVDAQGAPFLIQGDTAWSAMVQLTREEVDQYLEDRRLKGFNTVLVELIEHEFADSPPRNQYGQGPFTSPGDFGTPNEAYFQHVDYVIASAAAKGLLVMLTPAYVGSGGGSQGWWQEMQSNGVAKLRAYGQYLGNRYRNSPNILWVQGGDFNVPNKDLVRAIVNGIRDVETVSLHTYHGERGSTAIEAFGTADAWLTVNTIYTNATYVVSEAFQEYNRSSMPFFLIEAEYENEGVDDRGVRTQAYQSILSGSSGHLMGNNPMWYFNAPGWPNYSGRTWQQELNSAGARSVKAMSEIFSHQAWWKLVPDMNGSFVVAGIGSGFDRTASAKADDGSFATIYIPLNHSVTVNTNLLTGPRVTARWCDPLTGVCTATAGSPLARSNAQVLTPTGNNSGGDGDWVLVLESSP